MQGRPAPTWGADGCRPGGPLIDRYIVAGNRPWNRQVFERRLASLDGDWVFVAAPPELAAALRSGRPRFVFFLHWSWIVPDETVEDLECINFHMTDVPYGRGGSPLQNLIVRGHDTTVLTALRMTRELDAGPVYDKRPLSLDGSAQDIYERATELAADMIVDIVRDRPEPTPQEGDVVHFERRRPRQSRIGAEQQTLRDLYDHIRMLDADTYPHAFLEQAGFRFEFRNARFDDGVLHADVRVTERSEEDP